MSLGGILEAMESPIDNSTPQPAPQVFSGSRLTPKVVMSVILITALALGAVVLSYLFLLKRLNVPSPETYLLAKDRGVLETINRSEALGGTLYLTLSPKGHAVPEIYSYDIDSNLFEKETRLPPGMNLTPKFSPDGRTVAFARYPLNSDVMQVFAGDPNSNTLKQVTSNDITYKREPVWSPDGTRLVYVAESKTDLQNEGVYSGHPEHPVEAWQIYVTDLNGNEHFISRGYNPIFSPDGNKLIFLKNNGLNVLDLSDPNATPENVWGVQNDRAHYHMKLTLSHDGKTLVWTNHHGNNDQGQLLVINMSWDPFSVSLARELSGIYIYTAFSPDDRYLAVEKFVKDPTDPSISGSDYPNSPRINVFNLSTLEEKELLNLKGFDGNYLWFTDWQSIKR